MQEGAIDPLLSSVPARPMSAVQGKAAIWPLSIVSSCGIRNNNT